MTQTHKYIAKVVNTIPFSMMTDFGAQVRKHIKDTDTFNYCNNTPEERALYARKVVFRHGKATNTKLAIDPRKIHKLKSRMIDMHGVKTVNKYLKFPV